jgi:Bacterial Ig-like domain (group 1)
MNTSNNSIRNLLGAGLAALVLGLAGCGGSGAGGCGTSCVDTSASSSSSSSTSTSSGVVLAAKDSKLAVVGSSTILASDGKTPVDITAVVTSATNVAEAGKTVTFAVEDPVATSGVRLEVENAVTTNAGIAKAKLYLLGDATDREVKITVSSGEATKAELKLKVSGSSVTIGGPAQLSFNGAPSSYTVVLKDSSGTPIAGKDVNVVSAKGNQLSGASLKTDLSGQALFTVKGTVGGTDTITVTALGVVATQKLTVSGESLTLTPSATVIPINTNSPVAVTFGSSSGIAAGTVAQMSITQGSVSASSASITSGSANFTITSSFAGPATVTARVNGVETSTSVNFVSVTPTNITLQATPSTIGPNVGTTASERSTLIALVRDSSGNPVANQRVSFTATANPSGGVIDPGVATTDFSGRATAAYIAGPNTSPINGVIISARVPDANITSAPIPISVSRQEMFVRIGTGRKIEVPTTTTYSLPYAVFVTDATGNPVVNATVQAKLIPRTYSVGSKERINDRWVQVPNNIQTFPSEDVNGDGQCLPTLDTNGDGALTPGNVAAVSFLGASTTNSSGFLEVQITYPRNYGEWMTVDLEVTAKVGGSEGRTVTTLTLPIASEDAGDAAIAPVNVNSPFPYTNPRPGKRCGEP